MMTRSVKNKLIGLGIMLLVFGADFGLKQLMIGVDISLIGDFLELVYHENTGIAFSLAVPIWASSAATIVLLGVGSYLAGRHLDWRRPIVPVIFGFIAGGAVGNLFDRVLSGYVIDYISVWIWPVFNLADAVIFVGAVILVVKFDKITLVKNKK